MDPLASVSGTQLIAGAAFNAGLAYYLHKKHPRWALFFALNAAVGVIWAIGKDNTAAVTTSLVTPQVKGS